MTSNLREFAATNITNISLQNGVDEATTADGVYSNSRPYLSPQQDGPASTDIDTSCRIQHGSANDKHSDGICSDLTYTKNVILSADKWIPPDVCREDSKEAASLDALYKKGKLLSGSRVIAGQFNMSFGSPNNGSACTSSEVKSLSTELFHDGSRCAQTSGDIVYHEFMDQLDENDEANSLSDVCEPLVTDVASNSIKHSSLCQTTITSSKDNASYVKCKMADVYNGSVEMGYTETGEHRAPLLPTPSKINGDYNGNLPLPPDASCTSKTPLSTQKNLIPSLLDQPLLKPPRTNKNGSTIILLDSAILDGRLNAIVLATLLNKISLANFLDGHIHHVFYHISVENSIQRKMDDCNRSQEERQCMYDYLRLLDAYAKLQLVTSMDWHKCDVMKECSLEESRHCLRRLIISSRSKDPSAYFFYVTDMKRCTMHTSFDDPRVNFLDYTDWMRILD